MRVPARYADCKNPLGNMDLLSSVHEPAPLVGCDGASTDVLAIIQQHGFGLNWTTAHYNSMSPNGKYIFVSGSVAYTPAGSSVRITQPTS